MTGVPLDDIDGLLQRAFARKIWEQFFVAQSLHGDKISCVSHFFQTENFINQSVADHLIDTPVNAVIQNRTFVVQHKISRTVRRFLLLLLLVVLRNLLACLVIIFQRPDYTFYIIRVNRLRGSRINLGKFPVQFCRAFLRCCFFFQLFPDRQFTVRFRKINFF